MDERVKKDRTLFTETLSKDERRVAKKWRDRQFVGMG
jgi:hypothetical protein